MKYLFLLFLILYVKSNTIVIGGQNMKSIYTLSPYDSVKYSVYSTDGTLFDVLIMYEDDWKGCQTMHGSECHYLTTDSTIMQTNVKDVFVSAGWRSLSIVIKNENALIATTFTYSIEKIESIGIIDGLFGIFLIGIICSPVIICIFCAGLVSFSVYWFLFKRRVYYIVPQNVYENEINMQSI